MVHQCFRSQGISGQRGGAVIRRFTSTTKFFLRKFLPKINGYFTMERSVRFTLLRIRLEPIQSSNSTTGRCWRPSGDRTCSHSMIGKRNCTPPNSCGNLNSAIPSCITSSRASSEDFAAPVSMRAGSLTPHGKRITSSTAPNVIFSSALAVPRTRRESTAKVKIRIRTISLLVGIFPTRKLYQIYLELGSRKEKCYSEKNLTWQAVLIKFIKILKILVCKILMLTVQFLSYRIHS